MPNFATPKTKALLKGIYWKIIPIAILLYVVYQGFLSDAPQLEILEETVRNLYFHVPMWFTMTALFVISLVFSLRYLRGQKRIDDLYAVEFANVGLLFGFLGLTTGMVWAQFTWGFFWTWDPKQNFSAITLLIYLVYMVFRNSITDEKVKARVSAVLNVFAFSAMVPLIFILPRMMESLHPGADGNPAFSGYDLDGTMRTIFYPAVIGWALLGVWLTTLRHRMRVIKDKLYEIHN